MITPLLCQIPDMEWHGMEWHFHLRSSLTKDDYWESHQLGHVKVSILQTIKINLEFSLLQKKQVCHKFWIYVKWSKSDSINYGILSMLITWQVCNYRLAYKLLKINIFLKQIKCYSYIPTLHAFCLQTVLQFTQFM